VYYISNQQVNVLTPVDSATGQVQIQLTNTLGASPAFSVAMQPLAPGLFQFSGTAYAAATHADGSYIGPASLYPGQSTPARPGETIILYANGFGPVSPAVVNGSATQSGQLAVKPVVTIGGISAPVQFAGLVAPGEFQFNVTVPADAGDGDQEVVASLGGFSTPRGIQLRVQR